MDEDAVALKEEAAHRAVELVESGMTLGLGHGSTAAFAVRGIAERIRSGALQNVRAVACSRQVETMAKGLGIPLTDLNRVSRLDLTIDGADEVDGALNLIKGGGGALLREKMVAQATLREVIVADASKLSERIGTRCAVPVEVAPFGWRSHVRFLEALGARVTVRIREDGIPFRTDQHNPVLDARFGPIGDPEGLAAALQARAGIVAHGLFLQMAHEVIVAGPSGVCRLERR